MSAEIESDRRERSATYRGGAGSPVPWCRGHRAAARRRALADEPRVDRIGRRIAELTELNERQRQTSDRLQNVATQLETSSAAWRDELAGLRMMPAQLAELGSTVAELGARTEAPQRAWARSEALYLLELAQRRLELERDVRTAIVAMESAEARLSTLGSCDNEVRRLSGEPAHCAPTPDLPRRACGGGRQRAAADARRLLAAEGRQRREEGRPVRIGGRGLAGPFAAASIRTRCSSAGSQSLRRRHIALLLLRYERGRAAGRAAYRQALEERRVARRYSISTHPTGALRGNPALAAIDVDPPRRRSGPAKRLKSRVEGASYEGAAPPRAGRRRALAHLL
jgi:hypothetical protein